ncbi:hypothetical protein HNV11_16620 [Spirosoma taeanense]|uniref:DUF4198 domain-containing protein n=1 Tax=Spirosoma taeanense TaxID=2735870 RepID=A0A6M5YA86_9BACT|nr:hypothetical protein [Spirosoma taeanense]QJW90885.1 hypothetical protein HNV11_16620 [Spirosoma taeanense]
MKKTLLALSVVWGLCGSIQPLAEWPQAELSNGLIQTILYLPDARQGYYQGTRFDWSGAFKSLSHQGHSYVDQWFENYNPKTHDAINGPVEEFTPLGYADAKPGDLFVKIGVGALRKASDKPYAFAAPYDVADYGQWRVKTRKDRVEFRHELADAGGYGYDYTKTVRLTKGKPELVLEHRLKNTGQKLIETSVYNHNFFVIDKEPTGPQIAVRFPFDVKAEGKGFGSIIHARGSSLMYSDELKKGEQVYSAGLKGFGPTSSDYDIRIENLKTGAGVRATSDQPLEKLVFWACSTTSCPEPYIHLRAEPGQEVKWTITYTFYQNPTP